MANIRGTNLSAAVVPFTTEDSYATHYAKYGNGGWREVATIAERDAITADRLEQGMVVYVTSESKAYILKTLDLLSDPQIITWEDLKANIGLASVYTYKGQVNTIADLDNIQDPSVGDTYDVAENDHNYAWNGTSWDNLGGSQTIQVEVLPEPTAENEGQIVEYIGATQSGSTFEVVNTTTTNPVTVDLNKDVFETFIIESSFGEEYLDIIAQAPITLNYNYYEQAEQNLWGLYFGEELVGGLGTSELPIFGVTVTYTEGHEEINDTITLQYSVGTNVVNGYFYQSSRKPIPSSFYADVTIGSDYYIDYTSQDTYEDYVVNTLHEELQNKTYNFTYSENDESWTLDNSPVNLANYGIELHYNDVEVTIPASLDIDAETHTGTPATFSCDVNTFMSSYESMTGRTPEEDMRISFKGIYGEGWWEEDYTQRSYTDAEMASIWGVTITWTSGGQVQEGDNITINFKAQRTEYEPAQPQDNDVVTAEYTAESFVRTWLPKKVQDDGYKIDKFKVFPEATEENLGLIAQYVGETEEYESTIYIHHLDSGDAVISVDIDKNQFEQAIINEGGEEALSYSMDFRFEWDSSSRLWKCFRDVEHQGEEQIGELRTSDLESFGMYVRVEPNEDTLYWGTIGFSYTPAQEGGFHNGYFYESTKVENEESFDIENIENLTLDANNPYNLDLNTYRDYIESQGQELQSTYYNLHYATERPTSRTSGWYDESTGEEYELSDLGVTLNYATLGEINTNSNTICTQESFADSRFFVAKIDNGAIERLLDTYRIDYGNLTNSISIVFICIDGPNNKWRYNIVKDSILNTGNPEEFNINIQQREPQRAWQFTTGDTFTLVYSPKYDQNKSSSDYFVTGNHFLNFDVAYIDNIDIDTFERYIGTLPTTATLYKWECVSNDPSVEWTLNGVSANPSDYGLNLHQYRAPAYNVGDTVTMMYVPNRDNAFAIVYTDLTGTGSVASLDKERFISRYGSIPQNNTYLNFYCTDAGDYETSKWLNFFESVPLSDWGVNLDQIQDQNAYKIGDRIIVMYFAQPRVETAQPNDSSRFNLYYTAAEQYYEWVQKDVQPSSQGGVVDYNELENKPAINGVELNSETTTTDLGLMDLSTDQTANGTKIINELYQQDIQPVAIRSYDGLQQHPYVDCLSYVYHNDSEVWLATSEKINAQGVGYRSYTNEIPCIHKLDRHGNAVGKVYLDPDANNIISGQGFDSAKFLGGFCSNVAIWTNPNDNKKYLLGLTAPCILSIYSVSEIENGSIYSAVGSYPLFDPRYVSDLWDQYNKALNRIRIQGNNLYAFKEFDDGTTCGLYPVKFDLLQQRADVVGPSEFTGGGLYTYWSPVAYNKEGAHDYNIVTKNGVDYLYLFLDISNPFSDINGNYVNYPTATIYKFPLNRSYESENLQSLSYQFVNSSYDDPVKAIIRKIIKIDERYLLIYARGINSRYMYFNLFDTDTDSVVNQIRCKAGNIADDYTIYKELEGVYKVSGFIDNLIYQVTVDTNRQIFIEQDESEFIYQSLYNAITDSLPEIMSRSCTMFMWNDTRIKEMGGYYYFESPIYYSHRQSSASYGGINPYSVYLSVSNNLTRYATENYVDSTIASSGFITSEYLSNNGYVTGNWCNNYNIFYTNLSNLPSINGVQVFGNKTARDYHIIDDYGINITDTQMLMNGKAIRYDTPFQVATVIAGGGSEYDSYDVRYVIPSREENGVYYQVVNFRYVGDNTNWYDVFKVNTLTGERTPLCSDRYPTQFSNAEVIAGTYIADEDTLYFVAKRVGSESYSLIANRITNLSSDSARYIRIPREPVYEGTTYSYPAVLEQSRYSMETLTGAFIDNCHTIANPGTSATVDPNAVIFLNQAAFNGGETFQLEFTSTLLCYSRNRFPHPAEDFKKIGNNIIRYANEGSNHIGIAFALDNIPDNLFTKQTEILLSALGTRLMTWDDINDRMLFLSKRTGSYSGGEVFVYDGINPISNTPIASLPTTYGGNDITYSHFYTFEDSTQHFVAVANNVANGTGAIFTSSADGINWTSLQSVISGDTVNEVSDIVYLNNTFYVMKTDGRFSSMSTLGSTATVLPALTNRSRDVQGIASDGVSILAPTREVNSIFKYTPGVSQDWSEDGISSQSYMSMIYQNTYKASIKYSNGKYYIFFISLNGAGSYVSDYLVSNDCGKSWHTETLNDQTSDNYYMVKYETGLTSTGLCGIGLDSQDGIYVLQDLAGNVSVYTNNNSILNPSNITSLTSYKVETSYGLATVNQTQETYPLSNIHIDKNNTLLTQNIDELYLGEVGFSFKEQTFSDSGVLKNQFYGYLLRGNTDNKVYLAPSFLNPNSNIMIPFTSGIDGATVIKQSYEIPFLYLYMDDKGTFYNESTNSQISTLSHLNSGAYLGGNSYHNVRATDTSQYRNAIFKVMPTYTITELDLANGGGGSGYQEGDQLMITGEASAPNTSPAVIRIDSVDPNTGEVLSFTLTGGGVYYWDPYDLGAVYVNNHIYTSSSGTGIQFTNIQSTVIQGTHDGRFSFGNLVPTYGDFITPVLDSPNNEWKLIHLTVTDSDLLELRGDFNEDGGIAKIEYIDASTGFDSYTNIFKCNFYCLITSGNGTVKAYKSEDFSINSGKTYINLIECSSDLSDATAGTNYSISYLAQYAFVYNSDNFYITTPAFVNFKGKITDLYDTNFMELYTSHPTNGFVVPALSNKNFRHSYTKNSDFKRYYYNFSEITAYGDNWEDGVHTITSNYGTTSGNKEVSVTFEVAGGRLKQVFSITPELGEYQLSSNEVILVNPLDFDPANNIVLEFNTIDLNNTSFIPSIEKYGVVKRGYQVKDDIDDTDGYADTDSLPTVQAVKDYVSQHSGSSASTVQLTLDSSDWNSTTHEQTIQNITGLDASSIIVVVPAPNSMTDYMSANILCTGQATEELTFTYTGIAPTNNVIVNVLIM